MMEHQASNNEELTLTQRILVRAAELISIKENWIKGLLRAGTKAEPSYCMLGAIHKAAEEVTGKEICDTCWFARPNIKEVITAVGTRTPGYATPYMSNIPREVTAIHQYNDALDTKHEDVKQVFCKAVKEELGYDPAEVKDGDRDTGPAGS